MDIPIKDRDSDEDSKSQPDVSPEQPNEPEATKINVTTAEDAPSEDAADSRTTKPEPKQPGSDETNTTEVREEPPAEKAEVEFIDSDSALEGEVMLPQKFSESRLTHQRPDEPQKVEIKISFPSFSMSRWLNIRSWFKKYTAKQKLTAGGLLAALILVGSGVIVLNPFDNTQSDVASDADGSVASSQLSQLERSTPDYETLTPGAQDARNIEWFRVSPEGTDPAYVFADTINGTFIRVSQQQLPPSFRENPAGQLERTARESGLPEKINVEGDTAYIGAVADGRRSVMLIKQDLLVFIDTAEGLSTDQLANYISSLE